MVGIQRRHGNYMIIATVTSCPRRWNDYQRLRRKFESLNLGFDLRTFQTTECPGDAFANNNLNARSALLYCWRHLRGDNDWMLYLEDDIQISPQLAAVLPELLETDELDAVDLWYLCNRKNPVIEQFRVGGLVLNRLDYPIDGSHALLIPRRHIPLMLDVHWGQPADRSMFAAIHSFSWKVFQIISPVLVEHTGEYSTYDPHTRRKLEVNYAAGPNTNPTCE